MRKQRFDSQKDCDEAFKLVISTLLSDNDYELYILEHGTFHLGDKDSDTYNNNPPKNPLPDPF